MLKQSVSLKLLLLLLVLSLGLTMIAVAVTNGKTETGTEGATSTGTEDTTSETETEAVVDPTVIFSHQSEDVMVYNRPSTDGSNQIRYYIGKTTLKPNTTYEISWKCADEISNTSFELSVGFLYVVDGEYKEYTLTAADLDFFWENTVEFTTPASSASTVDFYFRVAQGIYEEDAEPDYSYAEFILDCVEFWVREASKGA